MRNFSQHTLLEVVRNLSEPLLASQSTELVELTSHRHGRQLVLRFLVDKVGGVTIHECARLNQLIGETLDESKLIDDRYTLEVSSPGLDRPLGSKRDFERALGEEVTIELVESIRGSKQIQGQLLAVQEEAIVVKTRSENVTIPLDRIRLAVKAIRLSSL